MKRIFAAAGALLLSTSAVAFAADTGTVDKSPLQSGVETSKTGKIHSDTAWDRSLAAEKTAISKYDGFDKAATADMAETKLAMAPAGDWADKSAWGDPAAAKVQTAASDGWSNESHPVAMSDKSTSTQTAMGGPLDETGTMTAASLTPRPATTNYPPCEPGPGDDRCIQLYERGVRAQLASWNAPTGGLADNSATTAMGGPYEPVQDHADAYPASGMSDAALHDDAAAYPALTESAHTDTASHDGSAYQGVGGPTEVQAGYPPCEPGPGDDRCIQLYERGVTGAAD